MSAYSSAAASPSRPCAALLVVRRAADRLHQKEDPILTTVRRSPPRPCARSPIRSTWCADGTHPMLHTWGSALTHRPHVHGIMPGGGIGTHVRRWVPCKQVLPLVRVLSRFFRRTSRHLNLRVLPDPKSCLSKRKRSSKPCHRADACRIARSAQTHRRNRVRSCSGTAGSEVASIFSVGFLGRIPQ